VTEQRDIDIVDRLDHMEKNIGNEYLAEVAHFAKAEITRLREQLRIAREGLENYANAGQAVGRVARDTLARMSFADPSQDRMDAAQQG